MWGEIMNLKQCAPQLIAFLISTSIAQQSYAIEIIVNESVNLSTISHQQIKSIYLGQQTHWPSGNLIKLYKLPSTHQNSSIIR